jgi:ATPase subunit of ABC transporter with duplicated ATPase domains
VGVDGIGKTTQMKIIVGKEEVHCELVVKAKKK